MGYSEAIHVSWGLLGMSGCYGATFQSDWEVSITFVRERAFQTNEDGRYLSTNPLPCGKLWSVKAPEPLCWVTDAEIYICTQRDGVMATASHSALSFTSSISWSFTVDTWSLFIVRPNLPKHWGTVTPVVAHVWRRWQTTACLLNNFC